ncbi:unnamed protein product [Gongylonema pulchrum]|uniref:Photolyase/cryptochrome alpha/beta domain-containing protein n=1 Tax=Gongylonema pulchrum TaxID=637853 RepID=A0A183EVA9_9BILA|nr:unnamed protein product [Gongylonema pulchrum]
MAIFQSARSSSNALFCGRFKGRLRGCGLYTKQLWGKGATDYNNVKKSPSTTKRPDNSKNGAPASPYRHKTVEIRLLIVCSTLDKIKEGTTACVLRWIKSRKEQQRFVENRLKEIRNSGVNFCYVSTNNNPVDLLTRGVPANELRNNELWWFGPEFLKESTEDWPEWTPQDAEDEEDVTHHAIV